MVSLTKTYTSEDDSQLIDKDMSTPSHGTWMLAKQLDAEHE
jgi:hypothetical protein